MLKLFQILHICSLIYEKFINLIIFPLFEMMGMDLERRLEEPISKEELAAALRIKSVSRVSSFSRHHQGIKDRLNNGELTVVEILDEIMWHSRYDSQNVTNAISSILGLDSNRNYSLALWIGYATAQMRSSVNGNSMIDVGQLKNPKLLKKLDSNDRRAVGETIDRMLNGDQKYIDNNEGRIYINRTRGLIYHTFR